MARRAALGHAQGPSDCFEIHFANVGVVPGFLGVAEGGIEDAPVAIHLAPGYGKIVIGAVDTWIIGVVSLVGSRLSSTFTLSRDHAFG